MTAGYARPDALRLTDRLARQLGDPHLVVLDGSFHLPGSGRDPRVEFADRRIPGARFFDVDDVCDPTTDLPHMLPSAALFADKVSKLGIGNETSIVVYDQPGSCAAPRVWWTFRTFGHHDVAVLDGGLTKWLAEGRPVESGSAPGGLPPSPPRFISDFDPARVRAIEDVLAAIGDPAWQIIDNRPAGRFAGTDPEPRPALKAGHVPGARSLPWASFVDPGRFGAWRGADELAALFHHAGVDPARPTIAYCGSGITACTTALAAHLLGCDGIAVYDGSWAEWGNREDTPVERSAG